MSVQIFAATPLVCGNIRFVPKVHSYYVLDRHATAIFVKLDTGRHMKPHSVGDYLHWFLTKCELRLLHTPVPRRIEDLRKVRDRTLAW